MSTFKATSIGFPVSSDSTFASSFFLCSIASAIFPNHSALSAMVLFAQSFLASLAAEIEAFASKVRGIFAIFSPVAGPISSIVSISVSKEPAI